MHWRDANQKKHARILVNGEVKLLKGIVNTYTNIQLHFMYFILYVAKDVKDIINIFSGNVI